MEANERYQKEFEGCVIKTQRVAVSAWHTMNYIKRSLQDDSHNSYDEIDDVIMENIDTFL